MALLAMALADLGRVTEADAVYCEMQARARRQYVQPTSLAFAAAAAAREEEAIRHAREAFEIHDPNSQSFFPDTFPWPPGYTAIRDFARSSRRWGAVSGCMTREI
jgi:hypothetical protein